MSVYYKIARPDGWDFYTGNTINYREAIGKTVRHPNPRPELGLCSPGVLHASQRAEDCFQGGTIPCSLYVVEGTPVAHDQTKAGFVELYVREELSPATHFLWRYEEAVHPLNPLLLPKAQPTDNDLALLSQWRSVWRSVGDSVWASVGSSVWDSVRESAWTSVWDSMWRNIGASARDSIRDSAWAYLGYLFAPVIDQWREQYPYMPSVQLWRRGLLPSYDGKIWRLHSGEEAQIVYEEVER